MVKVNPFLFPQLCILPECVAVSTRISLQEKHPDYFPDLQPLPNILTGRGDSFLSPSVLIPVEAVREFLKMGSLYSPRGFNSCTSSSRKETAAPIIPKFTQKGGTAICNGKAVGKRLGKMADVPGCARLFQHVSLSARQSAEMGNGKWNPLVLKHAWASSEPGLRSEMGASSRVSSGGLVAKNHSLLYFNL